MPCISRKGNKLLHLMTTKIGLSCAIASSLLPHSPEQWFSFCSGVNPNPEWIWSRSPDLLTVSKTAELKQKSLANCFERVFAFWWLLTTHCKWQQKRFAAWRGFPSIFPASFRFMRLCCFVFRCGSAHSLFLCFFPQLAPSPTENCCVWDVVSAPATVPSHWNFCYFTFFQTALQTKAETKLLDFKCHTLHLDLMQLQKWTRIVLKTIASFKVNVHQSQFFTLSVLLVSSNLFWVFDFFHDSDSMLPMG